MQLFRKIPVWVFLLMGLLSVMILIGSIRQLSRLPQVESGSETQRALIVRRFENVLSIGVSGVGSVFFLGQAFLRCRGNRPDSTAIPERERL
jgi:hypothetical protein